MVGFVFGVVFASMVVVVISPEVIFASVLVLLAGVVCSVIVAACIVN